MLPSNIRELSGVTDIREPPSHDDEEERHLACSRTVSKEDLMTENENINKCLEIHQKNQISRDNAWSISVIQTFSDWLEHNHNFLNNFKVACPLLEASSKVYDLRVESVYSDVVRFSAGLAATLPDIKADPHKPKKRIRRPTSTVTINKHTLNGLLETVPMDDAIFGRLSKVHGLTKTPKNLMNNFLLTNDLNLQLDANFGYWAASDKEIDYTLEVEDDAAQSDVPANIFEEILHIDLKNGDLVETKEEAIYSDLHIRSLYTGYTITSKIEKKSSQNLTPSEIDVKFDMDAECEPVCLDPEKSLLDIDFSEHDALTLEEVTAINRCQGLRRSVEIIKDLRSIDSSNLEYSYFPLNKILGFWAGPSHWKFKPLCPSQSRNTQNGGLINQRTQRTQVVKARSKPLIFGVDVDESLYLPNERATNQQRRNNVYKKWDDRKLKLPTDLHIKKNTLMRSWLAPKGYGTQNSKLAKTMANESAGNIANSVNHLDDDIVSGVDSKSEECNDTILEITTDLDGAPPQVTKVVVPFAKHDRRIDMKNLKASCKSLLDLQFEVSAKEEEDGIASFKKMYSSLPDVVSEPNASSLTPITSFYSLLHVANENSFRLSEVKDSDDIIIRKIKTEPQKEDDLPSNF
ncbi:condensin complex subunit 2-like [Teleopsis dalmanni]|uniref:condensin complex subunit 2-like n=1 Tax=Teleopsis dalmanni TaxID=139649 RepID=UPI0018CDFD79|nr:condensin complex subunit 2-like [Teleopsis dalmanni]